MEGNKRVLSLIMKDPLNNAYVKKLFDLDYQTNDI